MTEQTTPETTTNTNNTNSTTNIKLTDELKQFVFSKWIESISFVARFLILLFTGYYLFQSFNGVNSEYISKTYQRIILMHMMIVALRLHQRIQGRFEMSLNFARQLMLEDSTHYFFYCMNINSLPPFTALLAPIVLYSVVNLMTFAYQLTLNLTNKGALPEKNGLFLNLKKQLESGLPGLIYLWIARVEMANFLLIIFIYFRMGGGSLLSILMYFNFLKMRYNSVRSTYTRTVYSQCRSYLQTLLTSPSIPPSMTPYVSRLFYYI